MDRRRSELMEPQTRPRRRSVAMESPELLSAKIYGSQPRPHSPFHAEAVAEEHRPSLFDGGRFDTPTRERFGVLFDLLDDGSGTVDADDVATFFAGFNRPVPLIAMNSAIRRVCTDPERIQREEFLPLIVEINKRVSKIETLRWDIELLKESQARAAMLPMDSALLVFKSFTRDNYRQSEWERMLSLREYQDTNYVAFDELAAFLLDYS